MSQTMLKAWAHCSGIWPINLTQYHRAPELTMAEQEALSILAARLAWKKRTEITADLQEALSRLLQPLHDLQEQLGVYQKYCTAPVQIILLAMHERSTSYWAWTEEEWVTTLQSAFALFESVYDLSMYHKARQRLLIMAYILGPQTDFFWPLLPEMSPSSLACKLFGANVLLEAVERIYGVLRL
jgi:hypothetical protein